MKNRTAAAKFFSSTSTCGQLFILTGQDPFQIALKRLRIRLLGRQLKQLRSKQVKILLGQFGNLRPEDLGDRRVIVRPVQPVGLAARHPTRQDIG